MLAQKIKLHQKIKLPQTIKLPQKIQLPKKIKAWGKKQASLTEYSNEQKKMLAILNDWRQRRTVLKINLLGYEGVFQSFVLKADLEQGVLILDELFPKVAIAALLPGQRFKATVEDRGIEYLFDGLCLNVAEFEGLPACWLQMPARLTHVQRRQAFRLPLTSLAERQALLKVKDVWIQGMVEDLSVMGVGIELLGDWRNQLNIGDHLVTRFAVEDLMESEQTLVIHRMKWHEASSSTLVGATFHSLSAFERNELVKRLMEKQRVLAREPQHDLVA